MLGHLKCAHAGCVNVLLGRCNSYLQSETILTARLTGETAVTSKKSELMISLRTILNCSGHPRKVAKLYLILSYVTLSYKNDISKNNSKLRRPPGKIASGQEAEKTNELLQLLGSVCANKVGSGEVKIR